MVVWSYLLMTLDVYVLCQQILIGEKGKVITKLNVIHINL